LAVVARVDEMEIPVDEAVIKAIGVVEATFKK